MSAARREDYELVQEEIGLAKHKFLKHVECRWLSLHPALLRILQQMNGLKRYFLTVLPEKQSSSTSNARCIRIRRQLESKDLVAQIHFLVSVADIFNPFLKFFQTEEPLFHLIYDQLGTLLTVLLGRFIRKDLLVNKAARKLSKIRLEVLENHLAYSELEIGEQTRQEIEKLSEEKQKKFVLEAKSFLIAATKHLVNKLPLDNLILRSSILLKPDVRSEDWAPKAIRILAKELKVSVDLDNLADEWRIYQLVNIPVDWHIETEEPRKPIRVDHFWRKVDELKDSTGERKYPSIMKVVKTALVLGHGNAEVERGFSDSGKSVTDDRVRLSEASINGIRATSDGLKAFKCPGSVPLTKQLTLQREQALHMEAQKQQLSKEKKDLQCEEKELERRERAQQDSMEVGDTILKEANAKLQAALKNKDFKEVSVAQAMIEAAQKKISTANTGMQQAREQRRSVSKRKQSIINTFLSQPSDPKCKKS